MSRSHGSLVPESQLKVDKFKNEVAKELGIEIPDASENGKLGFIPVERCGEVGGSMVKKMIEDYEKKYLS